MNAERMLNALLLLQARGSLSSRELTQRLNASEDALRNDMAALREAGVPVRALNGLEAGWQLEPGWRTLALRREATPTVAVEQRLYVDTESWRGVKEDLAMLPAVQEAVWRDRKLSFAYWKAGRERVERTVDPLGLVAKGRTWYLFALTPRGYRTYRISRMEEARVLDEPSERPPHFDLAAQWSASAQDFRDEVSREMEAYNRMRAEKAEAERRAAQELEIARQVQARLFPQSLPRLRTMEYAGACLQARQVGGDYYDFLNLGDERLGMVVGDIAGKGIAAALLMANLQANIRSQCAIAWEQPEQLLASVNALFHENTTDGAYATLFFAEYCDRARHLRYASCGHLPALLLRREGSLERLESTCTVVGLFRDWECGMEDVELAGGDMLVLYTDGITEAFNGAGDDFGEDRLIDGLRRHRHLPPHDLLDAVMAEVRAFAGGEQHDDITLIVARCRE